MKTFRQLMHEGTGTSSADNFVGRPADDEEATTYKPRSKGEQDFQQKHVIKKFDYAIPGQDFVFNGEVVREEVEEELDEKYLEEDVLKSLRDIVKNKSADTVKFKNGKTVKVDMTTANALTQVYDLFKDKARQKKFEDQLNKGPSSFMKMADFAFSVGK